MRKLFDHDGPSSRRLSPSPSIVFLSCQLQRIVRQDTRGSTATHRPAGYARFYCRTWQILPDNALQLTLQSAAFRFALVEGWTFCLDFPDILTTSFMQNTLNRENLSKSGDSLQFVLQLGHQPAVRTCSNNVAMFCGVRQLDLSPRFAADEDGGWCTLWYHFPEP